MSIRIAYRSACPVLCEEPRPHAWSMCAACFCPCIPKSRATPLGRSRYQTSQFPSSSEVPTVTYPYTASRPQSRRTSRDAPPRPAPTLPPDPPAPDPFPRGQDSFPPGHDSPKNPEELDGEGPGGSRRQPRLRRRVSRGAAPPRPAARVLRLQANVQKTFWGV